MVHNVGRIAEGLNEWGFKLLPAHDVDAKTHPIRGVVETTGRRVHSAGNFLDARTSDPARRRGHRLLDGRRRGRRGRGDSPRSAGM
ncbi:MAG: hypothetical protein OXK74_08910 [Gemmatimonadota bacterium]|nr:hypothetical protein [Gemmatimonadota bacterium]